MPLLMKQVLLVTIVVLTILVVGINAVYMLVSPKAWFRLPTWIRKQGTLTREDSTHGWGAVNVRIAGAVILAGIVWILVSFVSTKWIG